MTPLILAAWTEGDQLYIDGDPVTDHPYRKSLNAAMLYYPHGADSSAFEACMMEQDKGYRGPNRDAASYRYSNPSCKRGFRVLPAETWGIEDTEPESMTTQLAELGEAIKSEGWEWAPTAATLAGRILAEQAPGLSQLQPRWRSLAHAAIHQGPMVCARGGAEHGIAWDRRAAFLTGLRAPMPVPGTWIAIRDPSWRHVRAHEGIARATVVLSPDAWAGRIPPLPVRLDGQTIYPAGRIRGTWTIDLLRVAESVGATIEALHEAMICQTAPLHTRAADRIEAIKHKGLRKLVYTRYWGRLAALGSFEGRRFAHSCPSDRRIRKFQGSALHWTFKGDPEGLQRPDYRPDHAAFIASDNHRLMSATLARLKPDATIGAHVDCIWTDSAMVKGSPGGDFRKKESGPVRFYGIGIYQCGSHLAAQGYQGPKLTPRRLATWAGKGGQGEASQRAWALGQGPTRHAHATSDPVVLTDRQLVAAQPDGEGVTWEGWTPKGWVWKPTAEAPADE